MPTFFEHPRLNYSLANEDTRVEVGLLPMGTDSVLTVGGSGSRALPLLARQPKKLRIIDISPRQIAYIKMKLAALKSMSHKEYRGFLGIVPECVTPSLRQEMFMGLTLEAEDRSQLLPIFEASQWAPFAFIGGWERTMRRMSQIAQRVLSRKVVDGLFACESVQEQTNYVQRVFPHYRWNTLIRVLSSSAFFNLSLYRFGFPQLNVSQDFFGFYKGALDRCFALAPARNNFFLQMLFLGEIQHGEGVPLEFAETTFKAMKAWSERCQISFKCMGLLEALQESEEAYSFLSVSDVPSYFDTETARSWLQDVRGALKPGGQVVARYYRYVPGPANADGLAHVAFRHPEILASEWTQFYDFDIMEKIG